MTRPHRWHLYQVAHRAGIDARVIAAIQWAFAAIGGLVCVGFIAAPGPAKPVVVGLVFLPQLAWLGVVAARAHRAAIGRW